jgi:hypothetical protein
VGRFPPDLHRTSLMPITLFRPFSFLDLMFDWPAVPIDLDF